MICQQKLFLGLLKKMVDKSVLMCIIDLCLYKLIYMSTV
jgi:hypothetical protein